MTWEGRVLRAPIWERGRPRLRSSNRASQSLALRNLHVGGTSSASPCLGTRRITVPVLEQGLSRSRGIGPPKGAALRNRWTSPDSHGIPL